MDFSFFMVEVDMFEVLSGANILPVSQGFKFCLIQAEQHLANV